MSLREQVGIIKDVGFGLRDLDTPCLWFTLYAHESTAALQVFTDWDDIKRIIQGAEVYDVKSLEGRACWYVRDGNTLRFLRVFGA